MELRTWTALAVAGFGWGTGGVATRVALAAGIPPYSLVAVRSALAAAAMLAFLALTRRRFPMSGILWRRGAVLGTADLAAPFLLFSLALQHVSAGFAGLLAALLPAATALMAHFLLPGERLRRATVLGLSVAFGGVAVLLASGDGGVPGGGRPVLGALLCGAGVVAAAYGGIYAKRHVAGHAIAELAGAQFAVGALVLAIGALLVDRAPPVAAIADRWAVVVYLAVAASFLPFVLYLWILRHASATRASVVGYLIPLVAVVAGVSLLDERLTAGIVGGGALILVGVLLVDRSERHRPLPVSAG